MISEAAVFRAQAKIHFALRREPIGSRAALPFDPTDTDDVRAWLREQLANSDSSRYEGTVAYVAQALCFDALTLARNARRQMPQQDGAPVSPCGLDEAEEQPDRPPWWDGWSKDLEWVASLAGAAARAIVERTPHATGRKAEAMLSCLARTVAAIKSGLSPGIAEEYVARLCENRDFLLLPLRAERREEFRIAVTELVSTGNLRRDLAAAGLPWAGAEQWAEFAEMMEQVRERRRVQNVNRQIGANQKGTNDGN